MKEAKFYEGGCHCRAVRFRVRVDEPTVNECNCSICSKKGFLGLIVSADAFELLEGDDALETYRFNTGSAQHRFCRSCGIHPFSRPRSHPEGYDINIRCLDGDVLEEFACRPFDGQNWERSVEKIR
ncbi:MAG: GFA family protein [bacterium]|nr:GFA family protein [bacterium]